MQNSNGHTNVLHLSINKIEFKWHKQYMSVAEIRDLGKIPEDHAVFLQIHDPWADEPLSNEAIVDLARPGEEHFFSVCPEFEIILNGVLKKWNKSTISFQEVVILEYGKYDESPTIAYTVAYEDGPKSNPEGSMKKGSVVNVKNKMIFHVSATDKS